MTLRPHSYFLGAVMCLLALVSAAPRAAAITHTWNGASQSMNVPGNWIGGLPVSGSSNLSLVFPTGPVSTLLQDITNPLLVQSLQFGAGYTVNGPFAFRMSNLGAAPTISLGTGGFTVTVNAPVEFSAPTLLTSTNTISSTQTVVFQGAITGGDITFEGSPTQTVDYEFGGATANSLTGSYVIRNRSRVTLRKSADGIIALGGNVTIDGGILQASFGRSGVFAAGTDITVTNSGEFFNTGTNGVDDMVVQLSGLVHGNGTLTIAGAISSAVGTGTISSPIVDFAAQHKTVNVTSLGASDALTISAKITNGSFNKTGAGRLIVSNTSNAFTGTNVVAAGTLGGSAQSIGTVANSATVEVTGGTLAANQITGTGQVRITGTTTFGGAQGYGGGTIIQSGEGVGSTATLLGAFSSTTSGQVRFNQSTNGAWTGSLSGAAFLLKTGAGILTLGGNNPYTGNTNIWGGGLVITSDTAIGSGTLNLAVVSMEAVGSRTLGNPLLLDRATFVGAGDLAFTDTGTKTPYAFGYTVHDSTGTTDIAGKWINSTNQITVNAGRLAIGDPTVVNGFTSSGATVVNGGTLTVRSLSFITLTDVTLAGGTLDAPNGYAIPLGAALQGAGAVTGRVASANGSSILANGNLAIGDSGHVAGVALDGELYTKQFTVTLNDATQAVLGQVTQLGAGSSNGTLNAANGLVVNFGRSIVGRGQVNSTNTLARAVIMNGDALGESLANYLEFTGYVKGVGTFNNVAFSGTFAPGLSPALVQVGDVRLTEGNVLDMEIGGPNRGAQYDAFDVTGTMLLGGVLKLSLLNGLAPAAGDQWQLFSGTTAGNFNGYDLPTLGAGLSWDLSQLATTGVAAVAAGLMGDFDFNGRVDGDDLLAWQRGAAPNSGDLVNWRANFAARATPNASAVPEPTSLGLLLLAATLVCYDRVHVRRVRCGLGAS